MVYTYFEIGRMIVVEAKRKERATQYGKQLLKGLSNSWQLSLEKVSIDNLRNRGGLFETLNFGVTDSDFTNS
jgi:hypothetical protein